MPGARQPATSTDLTSCQLTLADATVFAGAFAWFIHRLLQHSMQGGWMERKQIKTFTCQFGLALTAKELEASCSSPYSGDAYALASRCPAAAPSDW